MTPLRKLDTAGWSRDDLIREARLQTDAIQRLGTWLRISCSAAALGFILVWWAWYSGGFPALAPIGVALLLAGAAAAAIIRTGMGNARRNVKAIMAAAGVDLSERRQRPSARKAGGSAAGSDGRDAVGQ